MKKAGNMLALLYLHNLSVQRHEVTHGLSLVVLKSQRTALPHLRPVATTLRGLHRYLPREVFVLVTGRIFGNLVMITPAEQRRAVKIDLKLADENANAQKSQGPSLSQLRPFLEIAIPFFREDRAAFYCLMGIVLLTLTKAALLIFFSYVRRDMFSALNRKDSVEFYKMIIKFFGALVVFVPIAVLYQHLRQRLALHWRKELTIRVLDKYYADRTFYIIECCKDIDNPDQRISEDLREFTSTSLDFFFILFRAIINLLSFSVVLYHICPSLFLAIILYALIGTYVTTKLGRSLVGQYYNKLLTEADFRFGLIRTRENAEGIAFYDSQATMEQVNIMNIFEQVCWRFKMF